MRRILVDTSYLLAIANPRDPLHDVAVAASAEAESAGLIVTNLVIVEVLNYFSGRGARLRALAAEMADAMATSGSVTHCSVDSYFQGAFALYRQSEDKDWSFRDCLSFVVMQDFGVREALTYDRNFEQAGFVALLRHPKTYDSVERAGNVARASLA